MMACFVLPATDGTHKDLVVVDVADESFAPGTSAAVVPEMELLEFLRIGAHIRPDPVLVFIGFGRLEPWLELPNGGSAARVDRTQAN